MKYAFRKYLGKFSRNCGIRLNFFLQKLLLFDAFLVSLSHLNPDTKQSKMKIVKWLISMAGALWVYVEPTIPFALLCIGAVLLDCLSAWRLNKRVMRAYPNGGADGKFKSHHAMKMMGNIGMALACMVMASMVDKIILPHLDLMLGNYVAAVFCFVEFWSILENESSCNGAPWAKLLQKIMVDKTKRHLEVEFDIEPKTEKEDGKH